MQAKLENLETSRGFCEYFNLDSEISTLESHKPWPQGMTSKMLLKTDDLRIVLIVMQAGARMDEHHSDGRISIQVLRGTIRIPVQDQVVDLTPGRLLALRDDIQGQQPGGDTGIFRCLDRAAAHFQAEGNDHLKRLVILMTDGQDNAGGNTDAIAALHIPVIAIGFGQDADIGTLQAIANATHGAEFPATDVVQALRQATGYK